MISIMNLVMMFSYQRYAFVVGIARKIKGEITISIQHIVPIVTFDSIQKHFLNIIISTFHSKQPFINLPKQSLRVTAPTQITDPIKSIPDFSIWEETPLTPQQQTVLHTIQQMGIHRNTGVSLEELETVGMKREDLQLVL